MSQNLFTPGSGGGKTPAQAGIPDELLPFVLPPSPPESQPEAPATDPQDNQPAFDPENPAQTVFGGPPPVYPGIVMTPRPASAPSTRPGNLPPPNEDTPSKPHIAVPEDFVDAIAIPDISALDLEHSWSSEFRLLQLQLDYNDDLVRQVATSLRHERVIDFYLAEPIAYLKNFAEYGWDEESDELAEEYIEKYVEEIKLQTAQREQRVLKVMQEVISDLSNDKYESVIAIDLDTGDEVFQRPGWRDFVLLQEENRDMVQGRDVGLFHNHPDDTAASKADLDTAYWLGARFLTVVTPSGFRYVYLRGKSQMELAATIRSSHIVAEPSWREDLESHLAFWSQMFAERDNPAEMVMLEDERLWWQQENLVIIPYNTTETREQVADRIGIPVEVMEQLNEGNAEKDMMYIPLPGWNSYTIDEPSGSWASVAHTTGATLLDHEFLLEKDQLISQWNALSRVEQHIEMALMGSNANIDKFVKFSNSGYDIDYALTWIREKDAAFNQAALDFQTPVALLKTTMSSELLFDYGSDDQLQDDFIRANFNLLARQLLWRIEDIRESWDGAGVANAHYPTLIDAYFHIDERLEPGETHPWDLDPGAPDLTSAPTLDVTETEKSNYVKRYAEFYKNRSFDQLKPREQEVVLYWIRAGKLDDVPRDLRVGVAHYVADDSGSVRAAAMISRMYSDQLRDLDSEANIAENPQDIARVWGRYRSTDEYFDYRGNARLALPIAEYWTNQ